MSGCGALHVGAAPLHAALAWHGLVGALKHGMHTIPATGAIGGQIVRTWLVLHHHACDHIPTCCPCMHTSILTKALPSLHFSHLQVPTEPMIFIKSGSSALPPPPPLLRNQPQPLPLPVHWSNDVQHEVSRADACYHIP